MTYGTAGRFIIQDVGVNVPLYRKEKTSGQDIVDRESSALLYPKFGGGCDYVADHSIQGFDKIRACKWGTMAMIQTPTGTQIYMCVAMSMGTNTGTDLVTLSGARVSRCHWADLCAYCCNDGKGRDITMVFFKKWTKVDYPIVNDDKEDEKDEEKPK